MKDTHYEEFCNRMKIYRKRLGYNQTELGEMLGISQNDYSKRENGLIMVSYDNMLTLHQLGMDIDELVSGTSHNLNTKELDFIINDCADDDLKNTLMRILAECIKYYRAKDKKIKKNQKADEFLDFALKQWNDFSMLEYVRLQTNYSQETMSEILGITRKKYRKYEKEFIYPDADTLVQMYNIYKCRPSLYLNLYDRRYYAIQNMWVNFDDVQKEKIIKIMKIVKTML